MNTTSATTSEPTTSQQGPESVAAPTAPRPAVRRARRFGLAGLVLLAVTTVFQLAGTPGAGAWVYGTSTGRPGAAVSISQVQLADIYTQPGVAQATLLANAGPVISRSPATTGAQDVYVGYSVERWSGTQWVSTKLTWASGRIPVGYTSVRVAPIYAPISSAKGYYRVSYYIVWHRAGASTASTPLGGTAVLADRLSDMSCITRLRPCAASAGYVQYGRLYSLGGGW